MKKLFWNGNIITMDRDGHIFTACGIEDDRIIYVGSPRPDELHELKTEYDETEDLAGLTMTPGFNDSHMHIMQYGFNKKNVSLFGVKNIDEAVERMKRGLEDRDTVCGSGLLFGVGWNQEHMEEGRLLTRKDLDRVSEDVPVCAMRACVHIAVGNTAMMKLLENKTDIPESIRKGIDFNSGAMREDACMIYQELLPVKTDEDIREAVCASLRDLNAAGITAVGSDDLVLVPGVSPIHVAEVLREMDEAGELTVRISEQARVVGTDFDDILRLRDEERRKQERTGRIPMFRIGPRKMLEDGSLGARSAEMIDGYIGDPDNPGIPNYTPEELYEYIREANAARMDVAIHAIGDKALLKAVEVFEKVLREDPWPDHRHGIVHAQIVNQDLLARMKKLNLQAYIQPIFIDSDMKIIEERIGKEHAKDGYLWKTMQDMGILTSGGSDCPVEPFDIFDNMRAAVTRRDRQGVQEYLPEEALTNEEALRLFTERAARAVRDEELRGTIQVGKLADFVLLDCNIISAEPEKLTDTHVLRTVVNGKCVFEA